MTHKRIDDQTVAELTARGLTAVQIAERLGFSERAVVRARARIRGTPIAKPPVVSADELAIVERLLADGASIAEAARTIGRSYWWICRRFRGRGWDPATAGRYARMVSRKI